MWDSDYPHGDSTWPESRKAIDPSSFCSLGDETVRRIVADNGAELHGTAHAWPDGARYYID